MVKGFKVKRIIAYGLAFATLTSSVPVMGSPRERFLNIHEKYNSGEDMSTQGYRKELDPRFDWVWNLSYVENDGNLKRAISNYISSHEDLSDEELTLRITYAIMKCIYTHSKGYVTKMKFTEYSGEADRLSKEQLYDEIANMYVGILRTGSKNKHNRVTELLSSLPKKVNKRVNKRIDDIEKVKKKTQLTQVVKPTHEADYSISQDTKKFVADLFGDEKKAEVINVLTEFGKTLKDNGAGLGADNKRLNKIYRYLATYIYFLLPEDQEKVLNDPALLNGFAKQLAEVEKNSQNSDQFFREVMFAGTPLTYDDIDQPNPDVITARKEEEESRLTMGEIVSEFKISPFGRMEFLTSAVPALIYHANGNLDLFEKYVYGASLIINELQINLGELQDPYNQLLYNLQENGVDQQVSQLTFVEILTDVDMYINEDKIPSYFNDPTLTPRGDFATDFKTVLRKWGEKQGMSEEEVENWIASWDPVIEYFIDNATDQISPQTILRGQVGVLTSSITNTLTRLGVTRADDLLEKEFQNSTDIARAIKIFYGVAVPFYALAQPGDLNVANMLDLTHQLVRLPPERYKRTLDNMRKWLSSYFGKDNIKTTSDGYIVLDIKNRFRRQYIIRGVGEVGFIHKIPLVREHRVGYSSGSWVFIPKRLSQYKKQPIPVGVNVYSGGLVTVVLSTEEGEVELPAEVSYEEIDIPPTKSIYGSLDEVVVLVPDGKGGYDTKRITYHRPQKVETGYVGTVYGKGRAGASAQTTTEEEQTRETAHLDLDFDVHQVYRESREVVPGGQHVRGEAHGYKETWRVDRGNVSEDVTGKVLTAKGVGEYRRSPYLGLFNALQLREFEYRDSYADDYTRRLYESLRMELLLNTAYGANLLFRRVYNNRTGRIDLIMNPWLQGNLLFGALKHLGIGHSGYWSDPVVFYRNGQGQDVYRGTVLAEIPSEDYYGYVGGGNYQTLERGQRGVILGAGVKVPGTETAVEGYGAYDEPYRINRMYEQEQTDTGTRTLVTTERERTDMETALGLRIRFDENGNFIAAEYGRFGPRYEEQFRGAQVTGRFDTVRMRVGWFEPRSGGEGFGGFQISTRTLYFASQIQKTDTWRSTFNRFTYRLNEMNFEVYFSDEKNVVDKKERIDIHTLIGGPNNRVSFGINKNEYKGSLECRLGVESRTGISLGDITLWRFGVGIPLEGEAWAASIDMTYKDQVRVMSKLGNNEQELMVAWEYGNGQQIWLSAEWRKDYPGLYAAGIEWLWLRKISISADWLREGVSGSWPSKPNRLYIGVNIPVKYWGNNSWAYFYGIHQRAMTGFDLGSSIPYWTESGVGAEVKGNNWWSGYGRIGIYWQKLPSSTQRGVNIWIGVQGTFGW